MVYTVLIILIVVASILLVGIVLIQKSKGGGLSENFGKANADFGVKTTTDIVEKITWGLMGFVAVLCILTVAFDRNDEQVVENSEITAPSPVTLPTNQPNMETPAAPAAPAE